MNDPIDDTTTDLDELTIQFCETSRLIPSSKASRQAAARGQEHSDYGKLRLITLKPGDEHEVRLLPSFVASEKSYLPLVQHEWPSFEGNPLSVRAVCPDQTDPALLESNQPKLCPACAAEVDIRKAAIAYALLDGKPVCLKFTEKNFHVFTRLKDAGCFDLERGTRILLWNDDWELDFKLLKPDPIDPKDFETALAMEVLHTRTWTVRFDLLTQIAEAHAGWLKAGQPQPQHGQYKRLIELLPECTLIRIPWGMKGPQELAWQNTPYERMASLEYRFSLDYGNIGLLCGRDPVAVGKELIADMVVIGLDADEDWFAEDLRRLNPWLKDTFMVEGGRGCKWFFTVAGEGAERCLRSTKIKQRDPGAEDEPEVGDWLSAGKQGVVLGLHPSGKHYRHNSKPLVQIKPSDFQLPPDCYLSSEQPQISNAKSQYRRFKRLIHGVGDGQQLLDLDRLVNTHRVAKGVQAACPACRREGKDSAGDNLLIYPDGHYSCARFIDVDPEARHAHNQMIYRLAAIDESGE